MFGSLFGVLSFLCANVSISGISFVHIIVFVVSSYVPPAKLHLSSSILVPSGNIAFISTVALPL